MAVEDVPFALGRSPAERRVIGLVHMLEVGRQRQPMLPKDVAVQMLTECSLDHSRFNRVDAVGFAGKDFSGFHVGVHDELLLGFAMRVTEPIKALVGHAYKFVMFLFLLLVVGQFLVLGLVIHGRQFRGRSPLVTLGLRGYLKE